MASTADWRTRYLSRVVTNRVFGEAAGFALSNVLVSALAVVPKAILAATLTISQFGAYSLGTTIVTYAALFFEFGLFLPAARRSALAPEARRRALIGSSLILYVPVGVGIVLFLFLFSFRVDAWFHVSLAASLRAAAPLAFFAPFVSYIGLQLAQGVGRLYVFSVATFLAQFVFVIALVALYAASAPMSVTSALVLRSAGQAVGAVVLALWLRPVFSRVREHIRVLLADARAYGFRVYIGRVLSAGTYNMDVLMLAAFVDARAVALYTLAGAIATALGYPLQGLSNALFSDMAAKPVLEHRWITISWTVGLISVVASWLVAVAAVGTLFPNTYRDIRVLVVPLAIASAIMGVTRIYNTFLAAHGRGRELQNASVVLTASNVALNFALIPPLGALGAAIASVLALVANLLAHQIGYRRYLRRESLAADT